MYFSKDKVRLGATPFNARSAGSGFFAGFTLIEIVMVIVIAGTLAVLAVPRFESFYVIKLNAAVKKVVSDIRYVQQLAIARHESYKIIFSPGIERYEVRLASDNSLAKDPFSRKDFVSDFTADAYYKGLDISGTSLLSNTLRFDWRGMPQEGPDGGVVDLAAERSIGFLYRGSSLSIYITPQTGRVRAQ